MPRCCPPIGRLIGSPPFDTRITRPWSRARRLPISRSERRASPSHHPPPCPRGAGAHGYPGTPDRRPLGVWPNCRPCAECSPPKFIGGLSQTAMGATLALVPRPRYGVSASLWCRASRFLAVIPPRRRVVRAVLCWRRLRRLPRRRPPGSGRLFRFLAAIRVDGYGITPGQKHSHRRCPVPQPTKPPRPLLVR